MCIRDSAGGALRRPRPARLPARAAGGGARRARARRSASLRGTPGRRCALRHGPGLHAERAAAARVGGPPRRRSDRARDLRPLGRAPGRGHDLQRRLLRRPRLGAAPDLHARVGGATAGCGLARDGSRRAAARGEPDERARADRLPRRARPRDCGRHGARARPRHARGMGRARAPPRPGRAPPEAAGVGRRRCGGRAAGSRKTGVSPQTRRVSPRSRPSRSCRRRRSSRTSRCSPRSSRPSPSPSATSASAGRSSG